MTGQDWSKSRVAACHMTGTSMLVIKGPASTVLPQLDQAQQGAAIQLKGWHSTAIIGQILQQKFYGEDQIQGLALYCHNRSNPAAKVLQRRPTQELAPYCHNQLNPAARVLRRRSNPRAGILLPQSIEPYSKDLTVEINKKCWHHTDTILIKVYD